MIIGYSGIPGNGMTYDFAEKTINNHQWRRGAYTNIDGIMDIACLEVIKSCCVLSDLSLKKQLYTGV